ncbi:MAG TPA: hybrid sensor histidine kinase/response regulator, partial [Burkholderiales bacterium]
VDWIAEGLSSVAFFLEPCRHGREPSEEAIALFFRRYEKRSAPPPAAAEAPKVELALAETAPATAAAPPGVDPELLQVFLEEAVEVLQTIEKTLPECKQKPEDRESLTTVRRAFHTLKGSGRMVGLTDIGEAAWEVEQVMNLWLEQKRAATPALFDLLSAATASFTQWIAALRGAGLNGIDASKIVELAKRAKEGGEPDAVTVGTVTVSRGLYEIYTKEAAEHIAVLEAECKAWRAVTPPADASQDFMRAAHTLGSTSRTAGFAPLADLASALELWTGFAAETTDPKDGEIVQAAVTSMHDMVESIRKGEAPASPQPAHAALRSLIARLEAARRAAVKPPVPQAPDGREKRVMRDDIDPQLMPIFVEEAEEIVPQIGGDLREWKANPSDEKIHQSLRRLLHTLKGSARMAGAIRLGELCHLMEGRIEAALESGEYTEDLFSWLEERMDRLSSDVERLRSNEALSVTSPLAAVAAPAAPVAAAAKPAILAEAAGPAAAAPAAAPAPRAEPPLPSAAATLRVNADTLDDLINEAGEVAIARSRVEAELRVIKQSLADLSDSVARLRGQLREIEVQADSQMQSRLSVMDEKKGDFDPLEFDRYTRLQELTRLMAESLSDVMSIQQGLQKNMGDTDAALQHQARISRDVQQELMRVRAVPFANLNERLYRITRQTARELGKKAELEISGSEVELDRSVLDRIGAPLEHMLRNALVHGIEDPAARVAAGKAESGRITITLHQESNEIALVFADDGAGLDLEALRKKGAQMGLLPIDREPSEGEIAHLIFASGLSTADKLSELAGRGVGMDVVKNEITAIGGRVDIATTRGGGTTFTVYLPLTLAVTQAVLVRSSGSTIALASAMVEQVLRMKGEVLAGHFESRKVEFQDRNYPLHSMHSLLGMPGNPQLQPYNSVLLLRSGVQRVAVHVDELLGNHEIVVKSIGQQLTRVPGVSGATVLADGTVALIMNPVYLAHRTLAGLATTGLTHTTQPSAAKAAPPVVMVVDDSLTVRKITGRLLEREGYTVVTAKDGVDALEQMAHDLPKVMLVDIEMPRMDGFDLARNVRG